MISVFPAILLMSVVGVLLTMCLLIVYPFSQRSFNAAWHYRMSILILLFFLVPIGMLGGRMFSSLSKAVGENTTQITSMFNNMLTFAQPDNNPHNNPQLQDQVLEKTPNQAKPTFTSISIVRYIPWIWVAGMLAFVIFQGVRLFQFRRKMARTCLPVENEMLQSVFAVCKKEMGVNGNIHLLSNNLIKTPMLVGLFRTCLVLPEVSIDEREAKFIFAHELTHYKRNDLWIKSLALLTNAIHWFNPASYWLMKKINIFCELSCDERVVADMNMKERQFYGETILNLLCRVLNQHVSVYATLAETKKGIERRLAHMMNYKKASRKVTAISLALMLGLVLAGVFTACTLNPASSASNPASQITDSSAEGIVLDGIDVPDYVLKEAKTLVVQWYKTCQSDFQNCNYSNWRIEALAHVYTYEDFDGMTLQVYQMNYEFLSDTPENVVLAGGMTITEDGWVMPSYRDCMYLIFRQDNDELTFLHSMMENDCSPGDETFTSDLQQALDS